VWFGIFNLCYAADRARCIAVNRAAHTVGYLLNT
jgi:hypothetical protein